MSTLQGFTVTQPIAAAPETVWAALTDVDSIAQWHGWDYDGLAAEIQFIYVDHAAVEPPMTLRLIEGEDDQRITVAATPGGATITVRREGEAAPETFDMMVAGWRQFFAQLQFLLTRQPAGARRTIFLEGDGVPAALATALPDTTPGTEWRRDQFQLGWAGEDPAAALTVLAATAPLASTDPVPVIATVSTFGLDDAAFGAAVEQWRAWWSSRVTNPRLTTAETSASAA